MQRLFVLPSVDSSFYRVAFSGHKASCRVPHNGLKERRRFSTDSLRSANLWLQNGAILRNGLQTPFVRLTDDSQCYATQRKRAQFVSLELQITSTEKDCHFLW
jgi:hypothetical protein